MKTLVMILFLACCSGCSWQKQETDTVSEVDSPELVQDAVSMMFSTYPPAKIRLSLAHEANDAFGLALVASLRLHGYAIAEYAKPEKGKRKQDSVKRPDGMAFAYYLDKNANRDELCIRLHIGSESLSRMYLVKTAGEGVRYESRGFWTRREGDAGAPNQER